MRAHWRHNLSALLLLQIKLRHYRAARQLDFDDASVGLFIGTGGSVLGMLYDGIRSEILRVQFNQALFIAQFVAQELREIRQEIQK